ncbi:PRC-barrel domain-containing protein [Candidatus Falkowbacteria bacterium]|nr:PRC-barrel domain-containing protein [Candidatus Falkowbacteria bacterium]
MAILNENLIGLPVYTESGQHLGHISDFQIDDDTGKISKYHIKSSNPITNIIKQKELIIDPSQVIEITEEKMIVGDNLAPQTTPQVEPAGA